MSDLKDRTYSRGIALQILYERDLSEHPLNVIIQNRFDSLDLSVDSELFIETIVNGVISNEEAINKLILEFAPDYPVAQIAVVDRNIVRIAIWEFGINKSTPTSVAINESVELAKIFGSESSPRFVNGVLGTIAEKLGE